MTLATSTVPARRRLRIPRPTLPAIPVPAAFKGLLPATHRPFQRGVSANSTLSYIALDPAAGAASATLRVIGAGGGPTYAHGS